MWETIACGRGSVKRGQRMPSLPPREDRHPCALDRWGARMANEELVDLLKEGIPAWNAWREKKPEGKIDL